jgi:dihydrofolate synthase/folylpolyglutamate synthase
MSDDLIKWLYDIQKYGIKPGLERIETLTRLLNNPQDDHRIIHVAGTNGKGSVCNFISSILAEEGYSVGLYTSPHLEDIYERITINGNKISKKDFIELLKKIKPIAEEMAREKRFPTFFEILTAMALKYFSDKKVDFAVLETGMGGRFDATNIIANPFVSVITNISLEHTDFLGRKIEEIAFEKAGVIKENSIVVTGVRNDKAFDVISREVKKKKCFLRRVKRDNWKRLHADLNGQLFRVNGDLGVYEVKTKLLGKYQGENIAISIATIEELQKNGVYLSDNAIINGIAKTYVPGRMELVNNNPIILLDGAHNLQGIKALKDSLKDFDFENAYFIFGVMKDKDIRKMLYHLSQIADFIIATRINSDRACNPWLIAEMLKKTGYKGKVVVKSKVKDALIFAVKNAKEDDLICVTGSLYVVGEARKEFFNKKMD